MRDRERERQRCGQREKQAPCGKPNAERDPRTLGSHPELKADAQPLSHPGISICHFSWVDGTQGPHWYLSTFLLPL